MRTALEQTAYWNAQIRGFLAIVSRSSSSPEKQKRHRIHVPCTLFRCGRSQQQAPAGATVGMYLKNPCCITKSNETENFDEKSGCMFKWVPQMWRGRAWGCHWAASRVVDRRSPGVLRLRAPAPRCVTSANTGSPFEVVTPTHAGLEYGLAVWVASDRFDRK